MPAKTYHEHFIEDYANKITKETFETLYRENGVLGTLKILKCDHSTIYGLLDYFQITRNNYVNIRLEKLCDKIPKDVLYDLYITQKLSIGEILKRYHISRYSLNNLLKYYEIEKLTPKERQIINGNKHTNHRFEQLKNSITKADLEFTYEHEGLAKLCLKLHTSKVYIRKLLDYYNINYDNSLSDKLRRKHNHDSAYNKAKAILTYEVLYDLYTIQQLPVLTIAKNNSIALNILKDLINEYKLTRLSTSKNSSSSNVAFELILKNNNIMFEREFFIRSESKKKYFYDFKINNYLIEIDPFPTHNSSKSFRNYRILDKYYHQKKSKAAYKCGFICIHVFDWSNVDELINLIKTDYYRDRKITFIEPRRYLYDTKNNCLVENESEYTVEIYDDGCIID